MSWQTRSETNGIEYVETLEEALLNAEEDPTIWKISKGETRLVKEENGSWINLPIMEEVRKELKEETRKEIEARYPDLRMVWCPLHLDK